MINLSITGNVASGPRCRLKKAANGGALSICNFSVAAADPEGKLFWFRVSCLGKTGDWCMRELRTGTAVAVSGTVSARPYLDGAGQPRASMEIQADRIEKITQSRPDSSKEDRAQNGASD